MIDSQSAMMEGKSKDTPHCFRRTNIVTILIMANFICSTIWTLGDVLLVDVLVDVLDTSKKVGAKLNIHMASKEHGEMRIIRNNMLIGEGLLTLGIMSLDCVGEPILWSTIQRILVFIHYSLWTECLWESFGTLSLWIQTSLRRALMDHLWCDVTAGDWLCHISHQ